MTIRQFFEKHEYWEILEYIEYQYKENKREDGIKKDKNVISKSADLTKFILG